MRATILADLKEELGDLLLQVVFHARMAQEQDAFDFGDVVEAITTKLIRRHPHVFGDKRAGDPQAVKGLWEGIKAQEKQEKREKAARGGEPVPQGALAGVPVALPALTRALKLQAKASKVGFDWNDPRAVLRKIREETDEIEAALDGDTANARRPKSAICCSPRSISRAICTPIRKRCCGRPTQNSSAASRRSSARSRRAAKRRKTPRSPKWTRCGTRRRRRSNVASRQSAARGETVIATTQTSPAPPPPARIDAHRHGDAAGLLVDRLADHLGVAMQPAHAGAVGWRRARAQ